ncbi:MAG: hypothetical protein IJL70_06220 [Treponema sp.]|nr:hypothetical protein [Treponema sp.]
MPKQKIFTAARAMCFFAAIVLTIGSVMSFNHTPHLHTIFPKPEITIFLINATSAALCYFLVIKPSNFYIQALIIFIQAITTTLTGFETLGTFLYESAIILCFCNGFFKNHIKIKIITLILIWLLVLIGFGYTIIYNNPERGKSLLVLECAITVFFFSFYFYIYKKLESLLKVLVPAKKVHFSNLNLPQPGSVLNLNKYGLSERQIKLTMEYLHTEDNYETLSKKFFISKSTVKKDMSEVFYKFGVSNVNELHLLLLQYIVKE